MVGSRPVEAHDGETRALVVEAAEAGLRVDRFLASRLGVTRIHVRRLLNRGAVSLDGRRLSVRDKGRALVPAGRFEVRAFRSREDERLTPDRGVLRESRAAGDGVVVLAGGAGWLAVDKPAGMPVHPMEEGETGTVVNAVVAQHPELQGVGEGGLRSGVVHRLDVDTSGVLLVATASEAWERLRAAFRERRVEKTYRVLVVGRFPAPALGQLVDYEFDLVVSRHRPARVRVLAEAEACPASGARHVHQSVRVLEYLRGASLLEVRPSTGFLHQIRATLAHLGHPILGDAAYGFRRGAGLGIAGDSDGPCRQLLHAAHIRLGAIRVASPDPPDFREALERLRA